MLVVPTLFFVTLFVFLVTRFAPGGPVEQAIMRAQAAEGGAAGGVSHGGPGGGALSETQLQQLKAYFGYDQPPIVAYFKWLKRLATGDLGNSFRYGERVSQVIAEAVPVTLTYGLLTLFISYGISIPLGILKAMRHRTFIDTATSIVIFIGYAIPGYAFGALLVVYLSAHLGWFPMGGFVSENWSDLAGGQKALDFVRHAVLPLTCYCLGGFAFATLLTKNQLLDNLASDYVRTAVAKGCSHKRAVFRHAFRNSVIPLVTDLGQQVAAIVGGSILIETIFDLNGMGLLFYNSVVDRDPMVVMGVLAIDALLLLLCNVLTDAVIAMIDPRIRFK